MRTGTRWLVLCYVIIAWASLMFLRDVYEPETVREVAIVQMQSSDAGVQRYRAIDRTKHILDWAWIAIPITGVVLFRGEFVRVFSDRKEMS